MVEEGEALPKPPASRALCQAKRAPRAALPSGSLALKQTVSPGQARGGGSDGKESACNAGDLC